MILGQMSADAVSQVRALENMAAQLPQANIETEHVLHAGTYVRTIIVPAGVFITGALIQIPTVVIVSGDADVFTGSESVRLSGYHVLPAEAGRKQAFLAHSETRITMIFATDAQSVAQAEDQFTAESDRLLSRKQLTYTKEVQPCQVP